MRYRIRDAAGAIVAEGELTGELGMMFEANLHDHEDLVLEYSELADRRVELELPMKLHALDRLDAELFAGLFDVPVDVIPYTPPTRDPCACGCIVTAADASCPLCGRPLAP